ncbi:MAG: DUF3516 domain-containing protein [Planctomycetota bacterium]
METQGAPSFVLDRDSVLALAPLDATRLQTFLAGGAPTLAVGVDPRVPVLPVGAALLERLATAPAGLRLHIVVAHPGDGRSTLAAQLGARLAERADLAVRLWSREVPFDATTALEHAPVGETPQRRCVCIVDDAHERVEAVFAFVRALAKARGKEHALDVVLLADARAWVRAGGEARPWLHSVAELVTLRGASSADGPSSDVDDGGGLSHSGGDANRGAGGELGVAADDVGARERRRLERLCVAQAVLRAWGRDGDDALCARFEAALAEPLGDVDQRALPAGAPTPQPVGALFAAVRRTLVGDEDAWRAYAEARLLALRAPELMTECALAQATESVAQGTSALDALIMLALPALVGIPGVPERVLLRVLRPDGGPSGAAAGAASAGLDQGDVFASAELADRFAALAREVPLRRGVSDAGGAIWTLRHPIVAGAFIDALVDAGVEPLRGPAERLVDAALALVAECSVGGVPGAGGAPRPGAAARLDDLDPLTRRNARLAAALARPPEAVRWLLDDTGAEDLAVDLARRAYERLPRVDLAVDLVTALRRAGRADESRAAARDAWRKVGELEGVPEQARRLAGSWAISELRAGGEGALERCLALQLMALSDDVPEPRGRRPEDEGLPRTPFEVALRALAWLASEAHGSDAADALRARLEVLAPFAKQDPPERLELDETRARIEVTRPADVPVEPDGFRELLEGLDALVRHARPFAAPDVDAPLGFGLATRVYRRYVSARIGPLVRVLPPAGAASPGDAAQEAFEAWLLDSNINPYEAQMEAYFSIFGDSSVLLNTPTGSGKSLVALAAHFAALARGERSIYTAPTKALVNEKFFDLCRKFGSANVGLLTGDASVNRDAPILCCTAEILSNLAQVEGASRPFGWVVMDEFHYFSDKERGIAWLLPLMLLDGARYLLMSATIGEIFDAKSLVEALTGQPFELVRSTDRPVPLVFTYKVATERDAITELRDGALLPGYIVCVTRNEAAEKALGEPSSGGWSSKAVELPEHVFTSPFGKQLKRALRAGIGLHHSGLLPKYRRLVENLSAANELRLIFGTDTLGVGVNLPIRTVVFPQLVRNSGKNEYVRLDAARFQQLAGRAGRAGYATQSGDPQGDVWVLAPEDEIERAKAAAKAAKGGKVKKAAPKSAPRPGQPKMPSWSAQTMQNLAASPARPLEVRFEVSAALVMNFVRRGEQGVARLRAVIEGLPVKPAEREALLREVDRVLDTLVARREVRAVAAGKTPSGGASFAVGERSVRRDDDEEAGAMTFDRPLLRFLHDVAWDFLPEDDGPALDLLSLVESVVDDPRVVLSRQAKKLRDEHWLAHRERDVDVFDQSAKRDFTEERQEIEHPQPLKEEINAAFDRWDEEHPGLTRQMPSPKSVVRDMFELGMGFREYVSHYGLAVVEGELLRHLSEVWRVLVKGLPPGRDVERGIWELRDWLGALVRHVDSSLIDEWERMEDPDWAGDLGGAEPIPLPYDVTANPRAFTRMVRNAAFRWVRALAGRQYEELANEHVTYEALEVAHREYVDECGKIELGAAARSPALCEYTHGAARVEQTLADPEGYHEWSLVGELDLERSREEGDAVLVLQRFERKGFGFGDGEPVEDTGASGDLGDA